MEISNHNSSSAFGYLRFIASVFVLLSLLCIFFPSKGVRVGGTTLRFPKLASVFSTETRTSTTRVEPSYEEDVVPLDNDSVGYYFALISSGDSRIWLPDDDVTFFDGFFRSAEQAERNHRIVRVLHYGDSQIESDRITSRLRNRLQERFGGGGPGMIPLVQPIPSYSFNQKTSGNPVGQSTYGRGNYVKADGNYGPMLRSWRLTGTSTLNMKSTQNRDADSRVKSFSRVRVLYNNRMGNLSGNLSVDNGAVHFSCDKGNGVMVQDWNLESAVSSATLVLDGGADVYGIMVDDGYGVAVDNISMRGVSGQQFTMTNLTQLQDAYKKMDVGLIILQFGGNSVPYLKDGNDVAKYCRQIGRQIDYLHTAAPHTPILFVGPSDMSTKVDGRLATYPILPTVVVSLRDTVLAHGVAYWSLYDAMGGENSMIEWVSQGLAEHDYLHFNHKGAMQMGDTFSDLFDRLYKMYKVRRKK